MDAVVRPGSMIGSSQFSSVLSRLKMDGDSDSERVVTSLVDGPATLLRYEEDDDEGDEEDDTEDEYEFQDDYIYDIASRLKEVNAQHFAEPLPTSKELKVKFADNPVDRVLNYSPTPLMDVDERLQLKKEYLMKLFAKDDSERGDGQSDDSDLFSSSDDDDDFIDKAKTPSPLVELPRSPSPNRDEDGYDSDDETEQKNGVQIAEVREDEVQDELDNKIMELIERSVRSPDYHAGKEAAESLGSRIKDTIQESLKKEPISSAVGKGSIDSAVPRVDAANSPIVKSPSPEPPAVTLNESTVDMTKQAVPDRQPPRDLAIQLRRSPPNSPKKTPTRSTPPSPKKAIDRLNAPLKQAAFPPSPTRFIRRSTAQETDLAASQKRPRPPSSSNSSDTIVSNSTDVKKLPAYTGNERSRYGLPLEEKERLKEERDKIKREKEEKARQDEEAKQQRKIDAQKTFEAWLKNKESEKKGPSTRKKALSPQSNDENSRDFVSSPNTTVTFLTWLEGKKIQEKQNKLQHKLRQIELEELEKKHTRQDAQQAYRRWLRKKALETEQQRIFEKQKKVEEKLSHSSLRSKETLDSFFQSEHFHSLEKHSSNGKL